MDMPLSGALGRLSQHGVNGAAGVRMLVRHAVAHVAVPAALPGALDAALAVLGGRSQGVFVGGVLAAPPSGRGSARQYEIVRVQRPRAVDVAWPRPPLAAEVRLAPRLLCPVHLELQCNQC